MGRLMSIVKISVYWERMAIGVSGEFTTLNPFLAKTEQGNNNNIT